MANDELLSWCLAVCSTEGITNVMHVLLTKKVVTVALWLEAALSVPQSMFTEGMMMY